MEMPEEIIANLRHVNLIGFFKRKNLETTISLLFALSQGDTLPPIKANKIVDSNTYELIYSPDEYGQVADGGHHRAYAYFLSETPCHLEIIHTLDSNSPLRIPNKLRTGISESVVRQDRHWFVQKTETRKYRALPSPELFDELEDKVFSPLYLSRKDYQYVFEQYQWEMYFRNK
jgi:hypothetical protein